MKKPNKQQVVSSLINTCDRLSKLYDQELSEYKRKKISKEGVCLSEAIRLISLSINNESVQKDIFTNE